MLKRIKKSTTSIIHFIRKNYLISSLISIFFIIGLLVILRSVFSSATYIYVKIKMGQGYWWASTSKPSAWYVDSIKKGDKEYNVAGLPIGEVLTVRHYPLGNGGNDIYLYARLRVSYNRKTNEFKYNRSPISVGSPITLNLSRTSVSGTVIDISHKYFEDIYEEKTVYLINHGGYNNDLKYRYDNLKIGDNYFDGKDVTFEVLDKRLENTSVTIQNILDSQLYERINTYTQNIIVKGKIKLRKRNDGYYYGEEYKVVPNQGLPLATKSFSFDGFVIQSIE